MMVFFPVIRNSQITGGLGTIEDVPSWNILPLAGKYNGNSVVAKFAPTAADSKEYQTTFYNLDAVISVGYRVNSKKATQFRIWATRGREFKK